MLATFWSSLRLRLVSHWSLAFFTKHKTEQNSNRVTAMSVILETTLGDITVDLFTEERRRSCLNFLKLCKIKYYNYCLFFSVQRNFIAQTGDPSGSGKGGESIFMKAYGEQAKYFEMELKPKIKHTRRGMISFVNNGNNMHGSQFFITLCDNLDYLDGKHTVFGEVAEGFSVLDKINESICDKENRPYQDIRINHTIILDDPFDDLVGVDIPDRSPQPTREQLESGRIGADEEIDENKGKTLKEIEDAIEEKDLKIGTQILETVGDIKDASLNPPENVLFICKLNTVTTAEDLEIIFSRFGPVLSCEIIRDHKTGDSLCYGFIEFEKIADCEKAYFKMDNVLIDDRRIHVNFCQSIAKHKWSRSGLRSKYSFAEKETHQGQAPIQERAKKVALKSRPHRDEYQMVFNDTNHSEDTDEDRKSKNKKEKKKQRKMNRRNEESDEDEPGRKKGRKREADASRKQYSRSHAVYSSKRDEQYSMEKGYRQHRRYQSDEKKKSYSNESSSEETERGFEKSKRSKKEQRGTYASRVSRSSNERKQNSIKEKRSKNINNSSCEESCDEERTYRKNSKHKKKRKS